MPSTRTRVSHALAPLAVALNSGVNVPEMKASLAHVAPFGFNALRLTLSALVLGVAERFEARRSEPARVPWPTVVGLALLTSVLYQALFVTGMARTSASHTGFLIASGPLWTALFARALGVERPSARAWVGLTLAFVGTSLVASAVGGSQSATLLGNALVLASMCAWAVGTVWSRPVLERFPATRLAFLTTLVALPGHWILALVEPGSVVPPGMDAALWSSVVFSGVFSTGVAYVLWNGSVRQLGPSRTSAYTNLVPVCALAVAWIALHERPAAVQLGGGLLILLGLSLWRARGSAGS